MFAVIQFEDPISSTVWEKVRGLFQVTLRQLALTAFKSAPVRPEAREGMAFSFADIYWSEGERFPYGQVYLSQDQQRLIFLPLRVDDPRDGDKAIITYARELSGARYVDLSQQEIERTSVEKRGGPDLLRVIRKVIDPRFDGKLQSGNISTEDTKWVAVCRYGQTHSQKALHQLTLS